MKCLYILLIVAAILNGGCKKDKQTPLAEANKPDDTQNAKPATWTVFNTTNSPLTNDQVNAITISKNDVKWIGTASGLLRLSDNHWTVYNTANSPLPSADIRALAVENDGTVWIGTDNGLARFNGATWAVYTTANSVLTNNAIKCITHDDLHNTTWIGTEEGFVKVTAGQWEYIDGPDVILSMAVDRNGALWLGTFNSFAFIGAIKKYHNGEWKSYRLDQLGYTSALPYALAVDKDNQILAALGGTVVKSVIRFDGQGWDEITRPENSRGLKAIALEGNRIWVAGTHLSEFGFKDSPQLSIPGSDSPIQCIAIDGKGRKWMGTIYGGLAVYGTALNN
jgi:ligand-binding sensor domain-containing protein